MNLLGHGIDLVSLAHFSRLIEHSETELFSRSFQETEILQIPEGNNRIQHIAGRFAAKEAVLKALGVGFGKGVSFKDIQITRENGKPPVVKLSGGAAIVAHKIGITNWHLSISHSEDAVIASAIATSGKADLNE